MGKRFHRPASGLRRAIQISILAIFLILFVTTTYRGGNEVDYPINVFLSIDPLAGLSTLASSRAINTFFWPSLLLIAATALYRPVLLRLGLPPRDDP